VLRDDRERIAGADEKVPAKNHVAVAIGVIGGAQVGRIRSRHAVDQVGGVHQVRIRVLAGKILQWSPVDHRALGRAKLFFEDVDGIRAGRAVHAVEDHAKPAAKEFPQGVEVEQLAHQSGVIG
jgi:hypothetical protein